MEEWNQAGGEQPGVSPICRHPANGFRKSPVSAARIYLRTHDGFCALIRATSANQNQSQAVVYDSISGLRNGNVAHPVGLPSVGGKRAEDSDGLRVSKLKRDLGQRQELFCSLSGGSNAG